MIQQWRFHETTFLVNRERMKQCTEFTLSNFGVMQSSALWELQIKTVWLTIKYSNSYSKNMELVVL